MITKENVDALRSELSVKAKNGIDFTLSAAVIWVLIAFIWSLHHHPAYNKSVFTFIAGGLLLPLAFLFSKLFKTSWTIADNPLQPLGLWLNIAQLFYFPFLVFTLIKMPGYFVMVYAIITGAHLFPYAWFYKTPLYAIGAALISIGALFFGLLVPVEKMYVLPLFVSSGLFVLTLLLWVDSKKKQRFNISV